MSENRPPRLSLLIGELGVARDWARARTRPRSLIDTPVGDGAPVITLPGFLSGDMAMTQMRQSLRSAGYRARGWQLGANLGARADTITRIDARVRDVAMREGRKVHLVGWSLGGVMAREYAKLHPDMVASVVTMGSPFSGDPRANNAWRLYQLVARHPVDAPPIERHPDVRPPVPTYALWSARDGVVAPASARGLAGESDVAVEVDCRHLSFAFSAEAIRAVIECMQAADRR